MTDPMHVRTKMQKSRMINRGKFITNLSFCEGWVEEVKDNATYAHMIYVERPRYDMCQEEIWFRCLSRRFPNLVGSHGGRMVEKGACRDVNTAHIAK